MSRSATRWERFLFWALLLVALTAFLSASLHEIRLVERGRIPYKVDEVYWAGESYFFKLFFLDRDFENSAWSGFWGTLNPPLVKYIYGFALTVSGHPITDASLRLNFDLNWPDRKTLFANTPPDVIRICRITAWLFGLMTAGLIFAVASLLANRWLGIVALFLLSRDWFLLSFSYRAMSESIVISLICLFVLVCLCFFRKGGGASGAPHRRLLAILAVSVSIALLTLAKPHGPVAGFAFAVVALAFHGFRTCARIRDGSPRSGELRRGLSSGLVNVAAVGTLSIAIAIALNPYWHSDTAARATKTVAAWQQHVEGQRQRFPDDALHGIGERMAFVSKHCFPLTFRKNARVDKQTREMVRLANIGVLLIGIILLMRTGILETARKRWLAPQLVVLILGLVYAGSLVHQLPLRWSRYVLVVHPFVILLQSAVLWLLVDRIIGVLRRRSAPSP